MPASLLSLPAELRLQIYSYLWKPLRPTPTTFPYGVRNQIYASYKLSPASLPCRHSLALLQTCRLINTEAHKIAFSKHTFLIDGRGDIKLPDASLASRAPLCYVRSIAIVCTDIEPRYPRKENREQSEVVVTFSRCFRSGLFSKPVPIHAPPNPPFYDHNRWERWQSIVKLVRLLPNLQRVALFMHKPEERMIAYKHTSWFRCCRNKEGRRFRVTDYWLRIKDENRIRVWKLWVAYDEGKTAWKIKAEEKKMVWVHIVSVQGEGERGEKR